MGVSDRQLQYYVSCRREQDTCTARLTPDTVVDAPGLGPDEIAGLKLLVVDHQLAMKQMQFFHSAMAMGRIVSAGSQPHQHADAVFIRIHRQHFDRDAGRCLSPFGLCRSLRWWRHRLLTRLFCDSLRQAVP